MSFEKTLLSIPILNQEGLQSRVCRHFGKAPFHLLLDPDTDKVVGQVAKPQSVQHVCAPIDELVKAGAGVVVCGGLGRGALQRLRAARIQVLRTEADTVEGVLREFHAGSLSPIRDEELCEGHEHPHAPHD